MDRENIRLISTNVKSFDIDVSCDNFKGLIITDLHIGYQFHVKESVFMLIPKIQRLIEQVQPTCVFILGDLIHIGARHIFPGDWTSFFRKLERLNIETHIIPGNHEKYMRGLIATFYYPHAKVRFHSVELIRLLPTNGTRIVAMGHDLRNDNKVHSNRGLSSWVHMLRTSFSRLIPPDALLVLGHTHQNFVSSDRLTYTIDTFSVDYPVRCYGLLQPNTGGVLELSVCEFVD